MSDGSVARYGKVFPVAPSLKLKKHAWLERAPILMLAIITFCLASFKWRRRAVVSDVEKGWHKPLYRIE
jgi:cytochrome c-type biogenesis protein CcmH/NrfF